MAPMWDFPQRHHVGSHLGPTWDPCGKVSFDESLGRRWCLFLYAVASGLVLLSVLVLHMTGNLSQVPSMLTGMAVFGKIGVSASLGLVFVIAVEMYPTVVRCMGVSVAVMAVSGGSILADAFVFLEAYHYTVPFVVFGAMMASVGFAGLLFPETICRPLPNILPCRHRTIPLHEGVRLVTNPWDVL
ncbi:solute carrier family 22 member 15-like [Littorina saxatilis]|uniref:solute carrier family 22 member 15-like n=1 Tax=Littorina saxatilis TaxID=31220 RepID=UPI0038B55FE8